MSPEEFWKHGESIFSFLCEEHGFKPEALPNKKYINEYQARFVTDRTRIVIEEINWGFNIHSVFPKLAKKIDKRIRVYRK